MTSVTAFPVRKSIERELVHAGLFAEVMALTDAVATFFESRETKAEVRSLRGEAAHRYAHGSMRLTSLLLDMAGTVLVARGWASEDYLGDRLKKIAPVGDINWTGGENDPPPLGELTGFFRRAQKLQPRVDALGARLRKAIEVAR